MNELKTDKIYLRNITPEDSIALYDYIKDKSDNPHSDFNYPFSLDDSKKMFEKMRVANPEKYKGFIICLPDNQPVGFISFKIDKNNQNAEIGLWIAKPYRNKGCGQSAITLITNYAFTNLGLKLIYCNIDYDNIVSINLFKKCGYLEEAKLKERHFIDGKFKDSVILSKFNE